MSDVTTIVVPGAPVPWARAGRAGRRSFTRPPQAVHRRKIQTAAAALDVPRLLGAVRLDVIFEYEPPKSWRRADREFAIDTRQPKTTTPDQDNLVKLVADALSGIAFQDDKQVADGRTIKRYAAEARTIITIQPIFQTPKNSGLTCADALG